MFAADLACALAPSLLGAVTPSLAMSKREANHRLDNPVPEILSGTPKLRGFAAFTAGY